MLPLPTTTRHAWATCVRGTVGKGRWPTSYPIQKKDAPCICGQNTTTKAATAITCTRCRCSSLSVPARDGAPTCVVDVGNRAHMCASSLRWSKYCCFVRSTCRRSILGAGAVQRSASVVHGLLHWHGGSVPPLHARLCVLGPALQQEGCVRDTRVVPPPPTHTRTAPVHLCMSTPSHTPATAYNARSRTHSPSS